MTIQDVISIAAQEGAKAAILTLHDYSEGAVRAAIERMSADAVMAGAEAVKRIEDEVKQEERDTRLHNTRLLLKNYRRLKDHFREAVIDFDSEHAPDGMGEIWAIMNEHYNGESAFQEAIWRSATKTGVFINHVDTMLGLLQMSFERSGRASDQRAWRILYARFLGDVALSMQDIADREHVNKRTAEKDLCYAVEALSCLLFGIDAIR